MLASAWAYPLFAGAVVLVLLVVVVVRALSPIRVEVTLRRPKEDTDEDPTG